MEIIFISVNCIKLEVGAQRAPVATQQQLKMMGGGGFTPSGRANMSVKQMIATNDKKRFLKNLVINCEAFLKCMYNNGA
jgi:hypothetical protein